MPFIHSSAEVDFSEDVLVIPAVAYANIAQLAIDALLVTAQKQSKGFSKVGYWHGKHVKPVLGNGALQAENNSAVSSSMNLAIEFYRCASSKVVIMQRRSPLLSTSTASKQSFSNELGAWISEQQFKHVVLLTSFPAYRRPKPLTQPQAPQFAYFTMCPQSSTTELLSEFAWFPLTEESETKQREQELQRIPAQQLGGEITDFLSKYLKSKSISVIGLCFFASEGDNVMEGLTLAAQTCILLQGLNHPLLPKNDGPAQLTCPASWRHVYGPPTEEIIYHGN